jgi:putative heme-binding domain-containing protein
MDAKFAPDGSLYLADWYNPIIGHYQASFRHPDRDKVHGRIWRVTATGRSLVKPPEFLKKGLEAPVADVLAGLESDERFVREQARRILGAMPKEAALSAVDAWTKTKGTDRALFDALCIHQWHEDPAVPLLRSALRAKEPRLRAYAAGVAGKWTDQLFDAMPLGGTDKLPMEFRDEFEAMAVDSEPRVRLAAVVAAGNTKWDPELTSRIVFRAGDHPTDARLDYAREQAISRLRQADPKIVIGVAKGDARWFAFLQNPAKPAAPANSPKVDPKLAAMVAEALKQPAGAGKAAPEWVAAMVAEVRAKGDAKHGREIFRRAELACTACHRVGEEGGMLGPDLTNVGSAQPLDFIIGAVLEPQREIKEGFETREVKTKDGRVLTGFRRAAEAGEVAVFDAGTQKEVRVKKAEVTEEKTLGSLMPAGLVDKLSREDQRDLFRYLSELGKQR